MFRRLLGVAVWVSLCIVPGMWVEAMGAGGLKKGAMLGKHLIFFG